MQTANPVLSNKTFDGFMGFDSPENTMTVGGTVNKTGVLLVCILASAAWTWGRFSTANPAEAMPYLVGGGIVGFVLALITTFKMSWRPSLRPCMRWPKVWCWEDCRPCSNHDTPASPSRPWR